MRKVKSTPSRYSDVYIQDQSSPILDGYIPIPLQSLTLAQPTVINDRNVLVTNSAGVVTGQYLALQEGVRAYQAKILQVSGSTLIMDTPLDYSFSVNARIATRLVNLNVDGSTNVVVARLAPVFGVSWDINAISLSMTSTTTMDDGKFGGIPALTRGIVIRKTDGEHRTIFNAKTNGDLAERTNLVYSDKAPSGIYGLNATKEFNGQCGNGVTIRLNGSKGEGLECIIQDNLTGLSTFKIVARGHVVEE
jgi:hypothetical protein